MHVSGVALALLLVSPVSGVVVRSPPEESESTGEYFWPSTHGRQGFYGKSKFEGPKNLEKTLAWEWHHPVSRFRTVLLGALIDDEKNIYLAADDAIRKFAPDGHTKWVYQPPAQIPSNPCIKNGYLFGTTTDGHVFALDMKNGAEMWYTKVSKAFSRAADGVQIVGNTLLVASDAKGFSQLTHVVLGLDINDGSQQWNFLTDAPMLTFSPLITDKESFVFQDMEGRAYHLDKDGNLLWKNGGVTGSMTDGSAALGGKVAYTVSLDGCCCGQCSGNFTEMREDTPGNITAWNLATGDMMWTRSVPFPPNTAPSVGMLGKNKTESVVLGVGMQCKTLAPSEVLVFSARTGEQTLKWDGGRLRHIMCAGDLAGMDARALYKARPACYPGPWSSPMIDAAGTIYVGNHDGTLYAINDANHNGRIAANEVSEFDTQAAFNGPAISHAPGMMAVASCDGLFVFKNNFF